MTTAAARAITVAMAEWATANSGAVVRAIQAEAPVRSGTGREGLRGRARGRLGTARIEVTTPHSYMIMQHRGTVAHVIVPRADNPWQRLFFEKGGELVVAKMVHHPGTAPNDYPERGWNRVKNSVQGDLRRRTSAAGLQTLRSAIQKGGFSKW